MPTTKSAHFRPTQRRCATVCNLSPKWFRTTARVEHMWCQGLEILNMRRVLWLVCTEQNMMAFLIQLCLAWVYVLFLRVIPAVSILYDVFDGRYSLRCTRAFVVRGKFFEISLICIKRLLFTDKQNVFWVKIFTTGNCWIDLVASVFSTRSKSNGALFLSMEIHRRLWNF